jgi:predicted esterase
MRMQFPGRAIRLGLAAVLLCICATPVWAQKATPEQRAVPEWSRLRAVYDYDARKAAAFKEEPKSEKDTLALHLSFPGPSGETVPGMFVRPKAEGVYPCVLLLHGLGSDKETMLKFFGEPLVAKGIAVLALDTPHHGERRVAGEKQSDPQNFGAAVHEGCRDYRSALDWLTKRKDIDGKHIGLLGYSMGAMMGAILGGVENRISAFVLCVGGDPILPLAETLQGPVKEAAYGISPSLFVGHIAPRPILMLNGKQDKVMSEEASRRLFDAAKEPKQIQWFESGHILPPEAGKKGIEWLEGKLKSEKRGESTETKP